MDKDMEQGGRLRLRLCYIVFNLAVATHQVLCGPDTSNRGWLTHRIPSRRTHTAKNERLVQWPTKSIHRVTAHTSDCDRYFTLYPSDRSESQIRPAISWMYCVSRADEARVLTGSVPDGLGCRMSGNSFLLVKEPSTPGNCVDQDRRAIHGDVHVQVCTYLLTRQQYSNTNTVAMNKGLDSDKNLQCAIQTYPCHDQRHGCDRDYRGSFSIYYNSISVDCYYLRISQH